MMWKRGHLVTAESDIQNAIRRELPKHNCFIYRANVGKVKTVDGTWFDTGLPKGFPDTFGFDKEDKQIFFIEVKNEKGKPRKEQLLFHEFLAAQGITHGIARSVEDAVKIVKGKLVGYGY